MACGNSPEQPGRVRALVVPAPKESVRFQAPARASRCVGGARAGLVLQGATGGNGVLVWLRYPDSLVAGDWPVLQRGDSVSPRGAVVAVRFVLRDVGHGVPLDSGAVTVTQAESSLTVAARGSGFEPAAAGRVAVEATFDRVPLESDTASCRPQP